MRIILPYSACAVSRSLSTTMTTSTTPSDADDITGAKKETIEGVKERLLACALQEVPDHGWTQNAIAAAASKSNNNISIATAGLISVPDLISYQMDCWNDQLRQELQEKTWDDTGEESSDDDAVVVEKIVWALQRRLSYVEDFVRNNRWHEGMAIGAHPENALQTKEQLRKMIEIVLVDALGAVKSQELSLVERLSLGAVFVASELHMLSDTSEIFQDTSMFLRNRVKDWDRLRNNTSHLLPNNMTNIFEYHTPSDLIFTASVVGSALTNGVLSIIQPASMTKPKLPHHVYNGQGVQEDSIDGSHPSHYESSSAKQ